MRQPRRLGPGFFKACMLLMCPLVVLPPLVLFVQSANAQQTPAFDKGFDASKAVLFEDSPPDSLHSAMSPDGSMRAETEYKRIRVYAVDDNKLLHEFETSDHTTAPRFNANGTHLFAAVCRGNLGCESTIYAWDLKTGSRTRISECSGLVLDISTNTANDRYAAVTSYGPIFSMMLVDRKGTWYGGEIVVFDTDNPDDKVRIFCELAGLPSRNELAIQTDDNNQLGENLQAIWEKASAKYLPMHVRLTPDGSKVIAVTSTGVVRVFDAQTGKPELLFSSHIEMGLPPNR